MYAIDRTTGKPQWPQPLVLKQQGIVNGQPVDVPLYVMARHMQRPTPNSPPQNKTSITCVDKRSGRIVDEREVQVAGNGNNLEVQADPATNTVALIVPGQTITYELTDKEWPAPDKGEQKPEKSVYEGLRKIFGNSWKKIVPQPPNEADFQDDD
jgi:hypothetical protein